VSVYLNKAFLSLYQGIYGAFVIKFNLQFAAFRRRFLANHAVFEAVALATLTAMFGFFNRFLRLDMTESLYILFRECEGGGNYGGLCQYVLGLVCDTKTDGGYYLQDVGSMADGKLVAACDHIPHSPCNRVLWDQSPGRDLHTFYGDWCYLWAHGWYSCQGHLPVRSTRVYIRALLSSDQFSLVMTDNTLILGGSRYAIQISHASPRVHMPSWEQQRL